MLYLERQKKREEFAQKYNGFLQFCTATEGAIISSTQLPVQDKIAPNTTMVADALLLTMIFYPTNPLGGLNGFYMVDSIKKALTINTIRVRGGVYNKAVNHVTDCDTDTINGDGCNDPGAKASMEIKAKSYLLAKTAFRFDFCLEDLTSNKYTIDLLPSTENLSNGIPVEIANQIIEAGVEFLAETMSIKLYTKMSAQEAKFDAIINEGGALAGYTTTALKTKSLFETWLDASPQTLADVTKDIDFTNKEELANVLDTAIIKLANNGNRSDLVIQMSAVTYEKLTKASVCCYDQKLNPYSEMYVGPLSYKGIPIEIIRNMDDDLVHIFFAYSASNMKNPYIFAYEANAMENKFGLTSTTYACNGTDYRGVIYANLLHAWGVLDYRRAEWIVINDTTPNGGGARILNEPIIEIA